MVVDSRCCPSQGHLTTTSHEFGVSELATRLTGTDTNIPTASQDLLAVAPNPQTQS